MTERIQITQGLPNAYKAQLALSQEVTEAALAAGVDTLLIDLVKTRASQINACAFCLDMHTASAISHGEDPRRLFVLDAWRETDLYTEQERAALDLTEAVTRLSETRDLPDDVYQHATKVFTETQYQAVMWLIVMINSMNRLAVPARPALPKRST
jgi:AhpD family alkylhydroperoxidase